MHLHLTTLFYTLIERKVNMVVRALKRSWILVLLVFVAACSGDLEVPPADTQVTLSLQSEGVKVVDWTEVLRPQADLHHHSNREIEYVFYPADGGPAVSGHIADPRVLLAEFDENGQPDPVEVVTGDGLVDIRVPSVAGEIQVWAGEELLGMANFDPEGARTIQAELMSEADVLSQPRAVVNHGDRADKIDILFLPEGYTESDLRQFDDHVASITNTLKGESGYRDIWSGINIWRQDVRSRTRGTGTGARALDTAFETARGISGVDRCVFFASSRGQQAARRLGDRMGADVVVVLVNSTEHGGCARDGMVVTTRPRHVAAVVAHELGHALFGLADEYEVSRPGGYCSTGPNVAKSINNLPWADMLTTNQLPTSPNASFGTIGAFEGGGYCSTGRYRPTHRCMMRSTNDGFCKVCRREIHRKMARYVDGSGSSTSTNTNTNTGSTTTTRLNSPSGLSPNSVQVPTVDVTLDWSRVSGATRYHITVEKLMNGSYREFANFERTSTSAAIRLQETGGQYRWNVSACASTCSSMASAVFTYRTSGTSTGTNTGSTGTNTGTTGSTGSTSVPAVPTRLSPATSSVVSDSTPSMSWGAVSGASHYQFRMMEHDGNSWKTYVSEQRVDSNRVSTTLRTNERWYGFSVQACNSAGCSAWTEYSTMYLRQ